MEENTTDWIIPNFRFPSPELLFGKTIILYGAGNVGRDYYYQLVRYENIKIAAWVDKNNSAYSYPYYKVKPIDTIVNKFYDFILIAVLKESLKDSIVLDLVSKGLEKDKIIWIKPSKRNEEIFSPPVNCNIIRIIGGLGNQMFQYAFYLSLKAKGLKAKVNIDEFKGYRWNFELTHIFPNIEINFDTSNEFNAYNNPESKHFLFQEKEDSVYDDTVFSCQDASFSGYWQTEKYFKDIKERIKKVYKFIIENKSLRDFADNLIKTEKTVAVHIRRGDYLQTPGLYGGICTIDYYKRAMNYLEQRIGKPRYVIFSDDLMWVRDNLRINNAVYVSADMFDAYESWYDMYLMTCCKNNIIANSSFSWWGAWLNSNPNKIVIAPRRWLNNKPCSDIWCDNWIRV